MRTTIDIFYPIEKNTDLFQKECIEPMTSPFSEVQVLSHVELTSINGGSYSATTQSFTVAKEVMDMLLDLIQ